MLVAFDLDGTLANIDHRLHHVKNKPKCWVKFNEGIKDDLPNLLVVEGIKITPRIRTRYHFHVGTAGVLPGRNRKMVGKKRHLGRKSTATLHAG